MFELLATYLVETYVIETGRINAGNNLAEIGLWRGLIQQTLQRFSASESSQTQACTRAICTRVCAPCICSRVLDRGPVTRRTILRIYAPLSPSRGLPRSCAPRNQTVAGMARPECGEAAARQGRGERGRIPRATISFLLAPLYMLGTWDATISQYANAQREPYGNLR